MQTAIKVEQLSKSYGNKPAADNISLSVEVGSVFGLPADNALLPVIVMVAVTVITTGIAVKFFRWE